MWTKYVAVALTLALSACGTYYRPSYYRPAERALGAAPSGEPAALYDAVSDRGQLGEVRVWSRGTDRGIVDDAEATVLHLGFVVENLGEAPLTLDPALLRVDVGGRLAQPASSVPAQEIPPGASGDVELYFVVRDRAPQDVRYFTTDWSIAATGHAYRQRTAFVMDATQQTIESGRGKPLYAPSELRRHRQVVIRHGQVVR